MQKNLRVSLVLQGLHVRGYKDPRDTRRKCRHLIEPEGENPGVVVPMGQWHNLECLESGTAIMEAKDGAWKPLSEEEILKF